MQHTLFVAIILFSQLAFSQDNTNELFESVAEAGVKSVPKEHYDNYFLYWVIPGKTSETDAIELATTLKHGVTPNSYIALGGPSSVENLEFLKLLISHVGAREYADVYFIFVGSAKESKSVTAITSESKLNWYFQEL